MYLAPADDRRRCSMKRQSVVGVAPHRALKMAGSSHMAQLAVHLDSLTRFAFCGTFLIDVHGLPADEDEGQLDSLMIHNLSQSMTVSGYIHDVANPIKIAFDGPLPQRSFSKKDECHHLHPPYLTCTVVCGRNRILALQKICHPCPVLVDV